MIYITGDLHGDIARLKTRLFRKLGRKDTLIVCGDFGFIWNGSKKEKRTLKWIGRRRCNFLFIEGVHDNMKLIEAFPVTDWNGGKVREISGRLRYLCRGSVFELEGKKIFTFGGGESSNESEALAHLPWSDRLVANDEEIAFAKANLERHNFSVDYIVTHQSSRKIKRLLTQNDRNASTLDVFLDFVRDNCNFTNWFFAGLHKDVVIPPKERCVFTDILPISTDLLKK